MQRNSIMKSTGTYLTYDIQNTSFVPLGHNFLRLKETSETLLSVPSKVRWEITVRIRMNEIR